LNNDRHLRQTSELGGAPPAFAGYKLELPLVTTNNEGLDDSVGPNGSRQLLQSLRLENSTRLHRIWLDRFDR
jgi:hypothetical protein